MELLIIIMAIAIISFMMAYHSFLQQEKLEEVTVAKKKLHRQKVLYVRKKK